MGYGSPHTGLLATIAGSITAQGGYTMNSHPGEPLVILCLEHAVIMVQENLSKDDVRQALYQKSAIPFSSFGGAHIEAMVKKWHRPR